MASFLPILIILKPLIQRLGVARDFVLVVIAITALIAAPLWRYVSTYLFQRHYRGKIEQYPKQNARLICIGVPTDLSVYGDFFDASFEPAVYRSAFITEILPRSANVFRGIIGLFWVSFFLSVMFFTNLNIEFWLYAVMGLFMSLVDGIIVFLWPLYFRIVPGRLDVMYFQPFTKKVFRIERIPLHNVKIVADIRRAYLSISDGDKQHRFSLRMMPQKKQFLYFTFLAAMSSYDPPKLSDDDLIG